MKVLWGWSYSRGSQTLDIEEDFPGEIHGNIVSEEENCYRGRESVLGRGNIEERENMLLEGQIDIWCGQSLDGEEDSDKA